MDCKSATFPQLAVKLFGISQGIIPPIQLMYGAFAFLLMFNVADDCAKHETNGRIL